MGIEPSRRYSVVTRVLSTKDENRSAPLVENPVVFLTRPPFPAVPSIDDRRTPIVKPRTIRQGGGLAKARGTPRIGTTNSAYKS